MVDVKAKSNGHIALTDRKGESSPMYEILLGGWENKASVIRYDRKQPDKVRNDFAIIRVRSKLSVRDIRDVLTRRASLLSRGKFCGPLDARGHAESSQRPRAQEVLDHVARWPNHGQIGRSERRRPHGMARPEPHRREPRGGAHRLGRDRKLEAPFRTLSRSRYRSKET